MKFHALILLFFAQASFASEVTDSEIKVEWFKRSHPSIFAKETTGVTFLAKVLVPPKGKGESIALVQLDQDGKILRYFGPFSDNGIMGDRVAGDGIYSRKVQVYEKRLEKKYFGWVVYRADRKPEDQEHPEQLKKERIVEVDVVHRPSFIDMIKSAFAKF